MLGQGMFQFGATAKRVFSSVFSKLESNCQMTQALPQTLSLGGFGQYRAYSNFSEDQTFFIAHHNNIFSTCKNLASQSRGIDLSFMSIMSFCLRDMETYPLLSHYLNFYLQKILSISFISKILYLTIRGTGCYPISLKRV